MALQKIIAACGLLTTRRGRQFVRSRIRPLADGRCAELLRNIGESELGIILPCGIGDAYLACSLSMHLVLRHRLSGIVFALQESQAFIPPLFSNEFRSLILPNLTELEAMCTRRITPGTFFYGHFANFEIPQMMGLSEGRFIDCYRALFGLDKSASPILPRQPSPEEVLNAELALRKLGLVPGRTVIIVPDNRSLEPHGAIPSRFWSMAAALLSSKGYTLATNVYGNSCPLRNTTPLSVEVAQFRAFAAAAGGLLISRNGIADLCSDLRVNMYVAYPDCEFHGSQAIRTVSLVRNGMKADAFEQVVTDSTVQSAMSAVDQCFER